MIRSGEHELFDAWVATSRAALDRERGMRALMRASRDMAAAFASVQVSVEQAVRRFARLFDAVHTSAQTREGAS